MKNIILSILLIFSAVLLYSCSSSKEVETLPVEVQFQKAMELYEDESYLEAIEAFKLVTVQYQGSEFSDDAQFYLAECRFERREYILAASEYENLIRVMPTSPFIAAARYKKGLSFYRLSPKSQLDQKYTRLALEDFQTFVDFYPNDSLSAGVELMISELSDKIARKVYESGQLYYRLEYYRAAISYFTNVIEQFHDSQYTDDAMFWKAKAQYGRREYQPALGTLADLEMKFPDYSEKDDIVMLRSDIDYAIAHPNPTLWERIISWL